MSVDFDWKLLSGEQPSIAQIIKGHFNIHETILYGKNKMNMKNNVRPTKVKRHQISGNPHLNVLINRCFEGLCEQDRRRFLKKFRQELHADDQVIHVVRELVLGAYLGSSGFIVRYHHKIDGQTPDWSLVDKTSQVRGIVDLMNLHIDKKTENEIGQQRRARGRAVYWRDANKDNVGRLHQLLVLKAEHYQDLVDKLSIPYAVSVFADYCFAMDDGDMTTCFFNPRYNFFSMHPQVSGVLHFVENAGQYVFQYTPNPDASRPLSLPNGTFPPLVQVSPQ